jgi:hypothetical protein
VETRNRLTDAQPPQALEQEALAALRAYRAQAGYTPWNHDDNEALRVLDKEQKQQQAEARAFRDGLDRYQRRGLTPPAAFFDRIAQALPRITEITSSAKETPDAALPDQPEAEETGLLLVRLDPELGRLAVALEKSSEFRVWAVARHVFGKPGWVERGTLFESLQAAQVIHTRRHLNRLLQDGDGLFWSLANGKVYLRGVVKVAQHLTERAARTNPELVATNRHDAAMTRLIELAERGAGQPDSDIARIIRGFYTAQGMNIVVGDRPSNPLTNDGVNSNIADTVYVIAPWPGYIDQGEGIVYGYGMGRDAGRIAKPNPGTEIYIATDGYQTLNDFKTGVNDSGHSCNWIPDDAHRFGTSDYTTIFYSEVCIIP